MLDLISLFEGLEKPHGDHDNSFSATVIGDTKHRIAKNSDGSAAILLKTSGSAAGTAIELEHLSVQHHVLCRVRSKEGVVEDTFTVVVCTNSDSELTRYFLGVLEPLVRELGASPSVSTVDRAVSHLVELFRALGRAPTKSVSGLWAELFVISAAKNVSTMVKAWHKDPDEIFDFSDSTQRLEVKSSAHSERRHHFSAEQLSPPEECKAIVASLFVSKSAGGSSLQMLMEKIREELSTSPDLMMKLDLVVARTLGNTAHDLDDPKFDTQLASQSLRYYAAPGIPKIDMPLPPGVSDVHFVADLNDCKSLSQEELSGLGGIFGLLRGK